MKLNTENKSYRGTDLTIKIDTGALSIQSIAYTARTDVWNNFVRDRKSRFGRRDIQKPKPLTHIDKSEKSVLQIFDEKHQKYSQALAAKMF